jgi:hypothetical protein
MLRRESSRKSDTSTLLKEKDEIIKQVMAEGWSAPLRFLEDFLRFSLSRIWTFDLSNAKRTLQEKPTSCRNCTCQTSAWELFKCRVGQDHSP